MMPSLLLPLLLALPQAAPQEKRPEPRQETAAAQPAPQPAPAPQVPLGFASQRYEFKWDKTLALGLELDGLKVNSIFFNNREFKANWIKDANFGTRAQVEVTNGSRQDRIPGFAVAVFDKDERLLGVASGGTKLGVVKPGETETFDLNFTQVKERLPRGDHFVLGVELR
jgi:hypothetical protein